jgi:hypothetical protein
MTQSAEFMMLFRFEQTQEPPTPEQINEMHRHWGDFIGGLASKGMLVSTHQLGAEGWQVLPDHSQLHGIHECDGKMIGGNMVVKANSIEDVLEQAKKCPILSMGGTVEVRSTVPLN